MTRSAPRRARAATALISKPTSTTRSTMPSGPRARSGRDGPGPRRPFHDERRGTGCDADDPSAPATQPFGLEHIDFAAEPGRAGRPGRPIGCRQDHDDLPRLAAVRRRLGRGRDRRRRCPPDQARLAGRDHRRGDPGDLPVPRLGPRQPPLRQARGERGGADRRRDGRLDPRAGHGAPRGLRHDRRRARLQAVGRREAAVGDRARAAQGPADPDPRRGDLGARHRLGAAHPARLREPDGGPDDDRHRPPTVDDPARRPDHRLRQGPDRRAWHARRAARARRPVREALPRAVPGRRPGLRAPVDDEPAPIALAGV